MIVEDCQNLIGMLELKTQLKSNIELRNGFKTRHEEFDNSVKELESRVEIMRVLEVKGQAKLDVNLKTLVLLNHVNKTLTNYELEPSWIIDWGNNAAPFRNALKGVIQELDIHIDREWRAYTDKTRHVNHEVLRVLSGIPDFAATVQKVQTSLKRIDQLKAKSPSGEADFQMFDSLVEQMDQAWSELGSDDVPLSVETFLKASGSREGAPLELLTGEVKVWLSSRNIGGSFRVRMTSTMV
jgi:hypothetical protein